MKIRELQTDEWLLLKQLRLDALKADPQSFWEDHTKAQNHPDTYWQELAANLTAENGSRMFILENEHDIVGFVYGIYEDQQYRLGGLWIAPHYRKQGHGEKLVKHVIDWATTSNGKTSIKLWSPVGKTADFYTKLGFAPLGQAKTHPEDGREIIEMAYVANTRNGSE